MEKTVNVEFADGIRAVLVNTWVRDVECFSAFAEIGEWKPDWSVVLPSHYVHETIDGGFVAFRRD